MDSDNVLRQRNWTEDELQAAGFQYLQPRKRLIMARLLREVTQIEVTIETLMADVGDIVCYDPGDGMPRENIDDYDHWPVQRDIFDKTYKPWKQDGWKPNAAETHLMLHRCRPYYKSLGVWALKLPFPIYVQSLESPEPVIVPRDRWLCVGASGEPYHMNDEAIHLRYLVN